MMTLDADDLAYMKATQEELLPETLAIYDHVRTRVGGQGYTDTWVDRGALVDGRIGDLTPLETRRFAEQLQGGATAMLTLPFGTALKVRDQVVVMSTGKRWEVHALAPAGSWTSAVRALVGPV